MAETSLSRTVLIVDDHQAVLELFRTALTAAGIGVLIAQNGNEAIRVLHSLRHGSLPDLVLLDIMMPGIDGFETLRRLKSSSLTRKVPVIMLTVSSKKDDVIRARDLGATDYILKHAAMGKAMDKIRKHLGQAGKAGLSPYTEDAAASYDPGLSIMEAEIRQAASVRKAEAAPDGTAAPAAAKMPSPEDLKHAMDYLDAPPEEKEAEEELPVLETHVDRSGPAIYFQLKGDLTPQTLGDLILEIDKHLQTGGRRVVFDVSLLRELSESTHMECLARALERAKGYESVVRIVSYDDRILDILKTEEPTRRMPLFNSKAEALMSFR